MAEIKWIKKYEKKVRVIPSPPKPQTNADRIRMMSDEELAKWISGRKETCPPIKDYKCSAMSCYECWLAWMRKEAEDGRT